ncbi:MAG TPA: hypothetical protein PKJ21_04970 [Anaerolineae bacterium]|nr:hypothetical protein [Anaerolineae bacterium]HNT05517.1 hypothetical protein [Anaerolineae bacterium]
MPLTMTSSLSLWSILALLVPVGLALLAVGAAQEERAEEVAAASVIALAAAVLAYWLCGFAFQFGGVAFVSGLPGLQSLTAEWSPLDVAWGSGWGLLGLRGFLLSGEAYHPDVYALFLAHLPVVTTVVLGVLLILCQQVKRVVLLAIGCLVAGFIYPLAANWVWGGGWLANLGLTAGLGHGFVDAGGSGLAFLFCALDALSVLAILQPRRQADAGPARLPPVHFPLLMILGCFIAWIGWAGLVLGNPLAAGLVDPAVTTLNLILGAAGAAMAVTAYTWFVTTRPDAMAVGRGVVAGLVAVSSASPFVPSWAAILIGAVGGLLFLFGLYFWEQRVRLDDPSGLVATLGAPGVWGLLSVALFADGRWGAGWNGVGEAAQGVTGLLSRQSPAPTGVGQFQAQLVGLGALLVAGWLLPWLFFKLLLWLREQLRRAKAAHAAADAAAGASTSSGEAPPEEPQPTEAAAHDPEETPAAG